MIAILALLGPALADEPADTEPHDTAVLTGPIGPIVAVVANVLEIPSFDANLRVLHVHGDRWGWTAQTDVITTVPFFVRATHVGLRGGPRLSLRGRGLSDWTVGAFGILGITDVSVAGGSLARYAVVGGGLEGGRTWVWKRFTMELGLAVYSTGNIAYASDAEVLEDERPASLSPIKPSVNWSLGYAF